MQFQVYLLFCLQMPVHLCSQSQGKKNIITQKPGTLASCNLAASLQTLCFCLVFPEQYIKGTLDKKEHEN